MALALARARIMGARYPFYLLADSREGQIKEAEVTRTAPSSQPVHGNIRHGFVYERVPHITLKSIANNAEIDVIWDQWQAKLEPLREKLNAALKKQWQEWEIPREEIRDDSGVLWLKHGTQSESKASARRTAWLERCGISRGQRVQIDRQVHRRQGRVRISLRQAVRGQQEGPRRRTIHR